MTIFVHGISWLTMCRTGTIGLEAGTAEAVSKALDDAHDATTIRTGGNLGPRQSVRIDRRRLAIVWRCPLTIEKFAAEGEFGSAMAVGHEAEVADAMEAIGQRVKKEAADELVGLELHDLCRAVLAVVLPGKGDVILVVQDAAAQLAFRSGDPPSRAV